MWKRCYISRIRAFVLIALFIQLFIIFIWFSGKPFHLAKNVPFSVQSVNLSCNKWPPTNISDFENNGTYILNICIRRSPGAEFNDEPKRYLQRYLFTVFRENKRMNFDEISNLPPEELSKVRYPQIYDTYPQDVPIKNIIRQVKAGSNVSYKPNYNFPIKILRTSSSVCHGVTRHNLVVVVKSGIYNFEAREEFRAFMRKEMFSRPSFKVGYVFSVGLPRAHGGRTFIRDGNIMNLTTPAGDMLEKYDGKSKYVMDKVHLEMLKYDDIVLGDYEDTYFNLSLKTVTNLRWISAFCDKSQGDFFMIMDDDHRMNLSFVENFAKIKSASDLRLSIYGKIAKNNRADRSPNSKIFISYHAMPFGILAPYPLGLCQLIGADIVDDMAIATAYTRFADVSEDVYLGMLAYKLNIPLRNIFNIFREAEYPKFRKTHSAMIASKNDI